MQPDKLYIVINTTLDENNLSAIANIGYILYNPLEGNLLGI